MRTWVNVARILDAKSRKGGFSVCAAEGLPFLLSEGMDVSIVPPQYDTPRSGAIVSIRMTSDTHAVIQLDTVADLDTAERLEGCYLLVRESDIPEEILVDGFAFLEGFRIIDASLGEIGTVGEVLRNPAQTLLEVRESGALIPCVDEFVKNIDYDECIVSVNIPAGLLDL